jgi:hypothetical protein
MTPKVVKASEGDKNVCDFSLRLFQTNIPCKLTFQLFCVKIFSHKMALKLLQVLQRIFMISYFHYNHTFSLLLGQKGKHRVSREY